MAPHHHSGADDLHMDMRWMALNAQVTWSGLKETAILYSVGYLHNGHTCFGSKLFAPWACNTSMIPLHWCPKFVSAGKHLSLFGLREDELLPDLHITRKGVLSIGLGAHQEHRVNHEEARAADRTKVPVEVIQLAHEVEPEPPKTESEGGSSDSDGSESVSDSGQNNPPSSLAADAEQHELMQTSYGAVGKDFDQEHFIGSEYGKLQRQELVPERWPLARLSFSLQKCVDHLDRVVAGCCWEVQATRVNPPESLLSLHREAKCLTMQLAVYLAKEVAAILWAVLTHETKKLYNDGTVHLLCSNYWIQPIYQELLHSSS